MRLEAGHQACLTPRRLWSRLTRGRRHRLHAEQQARPLEQPYCLRSNTNFERFDCRSSHYRHRCRWHCHGILLANSTPSPHETAPASHWWNWVNVRNRFNCGTNSWWLLNNYHMEVVLLDQCSYRSDLIRGTCVCDPQDSCSIESSRYIDWQDHAARYAGSALSAPRQCLRRPLRRVREPDPHDS